MDPTKIPSSLNEESVFISAAELKLSMRQLIIVLMAGFAWFVVGTFFSNLFHINQLFTLLLFIWILLGGIALAFVKKDGKKLDEYIGEKIAYEFGPKTYVLRQEEQEREIEEFFIEEEVEADSMFNYSEEFLTVGNNRVYSDDSLAADDDDSRSLKNLGGDN